MSKLAEEYPKAKKIILIQDNLNTRNPTSFYENVPAEKAFELSQKFGRSFVAQGAILQKLEADSLNPANNEHAPSSSAGFNPAPAPFSSEASSPAPSNNTERSSYKSFENSSRRRERSRSPRRNDDEERETSRHTNFEENSYWPDNFSKESTSHNE